MPTLFCLVCTVEDTKSALLTGLLSLHAPQGWQEESIDNGRCRYRLYAGKEELRELEKTLQAFVPGLETRIDEQEEEDWSASWKKHFTPLRRGAFLILPPWLAKEDTGDAISLIIEPKDAFGTGQHETTALCLDVLSELMAEKKLAKGDRFLDLGTGTGILAIAAEKMGLTGIGVDIDPIAITNARANAAANGVQHIRFAEGSLTAVEGEVFSLIFANILAEPLISMAKPLRAALDTNAFLLLSGLLTTQADAVEAAYKNEGLPSAKRWQEGEWAALLFQAKK